MQFTSENAVKTDVLKKSLVSVPSSFNTGKILGENVDINANYMENSENPFKGLWDKQHPLIHTWLLLSSISICFLSALFFIAP